MRKIVFLLILFSTQCFAQENTKTDSKSTSRFSRFLNDTSKKRNFFIVLNAGIALPFNEYGSTEATSELLFFPGSDNSHIKGYAKLGFHGNITGGYFIVPHLAIVAKAGMDIAGIQDSTMDFQQGYLWTYHFHEPYKIWQLMGGLYASVKMYKNTEFWLQSTVGEVLANYPSFTVVSAYNAFLQNGVESIDCNFESSKGVGYCISGGFENKICSGLGFVGTISYTTTIMSYPSVSYNYSGTNISYYVQNTPATMSYGCLQVTLGVVLFL